MAFQTHLLRRGGKQQQAGNLGGELFHALVAGAALLRAPIQVVGLIDDQQVEAAGQGLVLAMNVGEQPALAGQHELGALERVDAAVGLTLVLVQQSDVQREAAQQFDQPLVGQAVGHQNQRALYPASQQQAVKNQAGFDGFAQAHFVGQQNPRRMASGDFVGNIELMGYEVDARPGKTEGPVLLDALEVVQRAKAKIKPVVAVDLTGEQAVAGLIELHGIGQLGLGQLAQSAVAVFTDVGDQAATLFAVIDDHLPAIGRENAVAAAEHHAGERRLAGVVGAGFLAGTEQNGNATGVAVKHGAESKLGFAVANPALAGRKIAHDASRKSSKSGRTPPGQVTGG